MSEDGAGGVIHAGSAAPTLAERDQPRVDTQREGAASPAPAPPTVPANSPTGPGAIPRPRSASAGTSRAEGAVAGPPSGRRSTTKGKNGRVYERKFDWDEARARHAVGETMKAIAEDMDVSRSAVLRVVNTASAARMDRQSREWQRGGTCPTCGGPSSRKAGQPQNVCWKCKSIAAATTVRPDTLQCVTCKQWKPDDAFPKHKRLIARRGRHRQCTVCNTNAKRAWRAKAGRW